MTLFSSRTVLVLCILVISVVQSDPYYSWDFIQFFDQDGVTPLKSENSENVLMTGIAYDTRTRFMCAGFPSQLLGSEVTIGCFDTEKYPKGSTPIFTPFPALLDNGLPKLPSRNGRYLQNYNETQIIVMDSSVFESLILNPFYNDESISVEETRELPVISNQFLRHHNRRRPVQEQDQTQWVINRPHRRRQKVPVTTTATTQSTTLSTTQSTTKGTTKSTTATTTTTKAPGTIVTVVKKGGHSHNKWRFNPDGRQLDNDADNPNVTEDPEEMSTATEDPYVTEDPEEMSTTTGNPNVTEGPEEMAKTTEDPNVTEDPEEMSKTTENPNGTADPEEMSTTTGNPNVTEDPEEMSTTNGNPYVIDTSEEDREALLKIIQQRLKLFKDNGNKRPYNFISVHHPYFDDCGRLWFIDTGHLEYNPKPIYVRKPSLWAFQIRLGKDNKLQSKLYFRHVIKDSSYRGLRSLVVDVHETCSDWHVYIPNQVDNEIVVISSNKKRARQWSVLHPVLNPVMTEAVPEFGNLGGVNALAMGKRDRGGFRPVFISVATGRGHYEVSSKTLRRRLTHPYVYNHKEFKSMGYKDKGQSTVAIDYDRTTRDIFFATLNTFNLKCWNTKKNLNPDSFVPVVTSDLQGRDVQVDKNGNVWYLSGSLKALKGVVEKDKSNFVVQKLKSTDIVKGTKCEMQKRKH